jgi:hypothetical protein
MCNSHSPHPPTPSPKLGRRGGGVKIGMLLIDISIFFEIMKIHQFFLK